MSEGLGTAGGTAAKGRAGRRFLNPSGGTGLRLPRPRRRPRPVILDTDMNEDCDDAAALALLHALADRGLAEILGVTYCTSAEWGVPAVQAINAWYGRPDLPVGTLKAEGFVCEYAGISYIRYLAEAYPTGKTRAEAPDAVALLRRLLASRKRRDLLLVGIGPLVNLAALLDSGPDEWSPLPGLELVRRKVKDLVLMCGRLPEGIEYNLRQSPKAARRVLSGWPGRILICDALVGGALETGARLCREAAPGNPLATAYRLHSCGMVSASYDQATVLAAIAGPRRYFGLSGRGHFEVDLKGSGCWVPAIFGRRRHLRMRLDPGSLARLIEDLMLAPPARGQPASLPGGEPWPRPDNNALLERRKGDLAVFFQAIIDENLEVLEDLEEAVE